MPDQVPARRLMPAQAKTARAGLPHVQRHLAQAVLLALLDQEGRVHLAVAGAVLAMVAAELGQPELYLPPDQSAPELSPAPVHRRVGASLYLRAAATMRQTPSGLELDGLAVELTGLTLSPDRLPDLRGAAAYRSARELAAWLPLHNYRRLKALQRAHYREWTGHDQPGAGLATAHQSWKDQLAALVRARRAGRGRQGGGP